MCVCDKKINSTLQFNPLAIKSPLSEGEGQGGTGLSGLWKKREIRRYWKKGGRCGGEGEKGDSRSEELERYTMYM